MVFLKNVQTHRVYAPSCITPANVHAIMYIIAIKVMLMKDNVCMFLNKPLFCLIFIICSTNSYRIFEIYVKMIYKIFIFYYYLKENTEITEKSIIMYYFPFFGFQGKQLVQNFLLVAVKLLVGLWVGDLILPQLTGN